MLDQTLWHWFCTVGQGGGGGVRSTLGILTQDFIIQISTQNPTSIFHFERSKLANMSAFRGFRNSRLLLKFHWLGGGGQRPHSLTQLHVSYLPKSMRCCVEFEKCEGPHGFDWPTFWSNENQWTHFLPLKGKRAKLDLLVTQKLSSHVLESSTVLLDDNRFRSKRR